MAPVRNNLPIVAVGLGLVYAGLLLLVLGVAFPFLVALSQLQLSPAILLLVALGMVGVGLLLDAAGRLLCLAYAWERPGGGVLILASVAATGAAFAISLWHLAAQFKVMPMPHVFLVQSSNALAALGSLLFVLFLRSLAGHVGASSLVGLANAVLAVGALVSLALIAALLEPSLAQMPFAALGLLLAALILLVMYGNLLTYLRKAVLKHVGGPEPTGAP